MWALFLRESARISVWAKSCSSGTGGNTMKKCFLKKGLFSFRFSPLSLGVASATLLPRTVQNGGIHIPVTAGTAVTCGGPTFDSFRLLNPAAGAAGIINLLTGSEYVC
jgi:hypothetical protein